MSRSVPTSRIRSANDRPLRPERGHVLYWMTALRRPAWNFALDRAIELAREHGKPLVVLEGLRAGYRWANDRHHAFLLDGMLDNREAFAGTPVRYYPYVEREAGGGKGLLEALAGEAVAVIADDYPCFFLPAMVRAAARKVDVRMEAVDGNGLLPVHAPDKAFARAFDFRRYLHRELVPHLGDVPRAHPLRGLELPAAEIPARIRERWPEAEADLLSHDRDLSDLPIDHSVRPTEERGGFQSARRRLKRFVERLELYGSDRNQPAVDATSRLSPYLHYGQISSHEILAALAEASDWTRERIAPTGKGQRSGWWGFDEAVEGFLDQLVTWREVGFNGSAFLDGFDRYDSLPEWARKTLAEHAADPRPYTYSHPEFDEARTHDEIWNAAQRQLRIEGTIHNYLRMLWGKKILHWSPNPRVALEIMIDLNNRYALDGRDPNSYSGIFWILGRYDRAWGPERPVFGKIRFMSSANTRRKLRLAPYLERWGETAPLF